MSTAPLTTAQLQGRARRLRARAGTLHPVLAETYRRRAAELDMQALLEAVWNPPIDTGGPGGPAEGPFAPDTPRHLAVA